VPRYWQLALGVLFVLVVVYLRGGIAGAITGLFARRGRSRAA
jgi:ABC-type branched-subunit amino acid transport system permease subunit